MGHVGIARAGLGLDFIYIVLCLSRGEEACSAELDLRIISMVN